MDLEIRHKTLNYTKMKKEVLNFSILTSEIYLEIKLQWQDERKTK